MSKTKKILCISALLVVFFTVLLLVWAHFLASRPVEPKKSQTADSIDSSFFEVGVPATQKKLQQKFSVYQTEAERDGKRTLTLFTREQTERLLAVRENGERTPLSYDEILFLINDSIRLYERCDEIVLTGASDLPILREDRKTGSPDHRIVCDHADLSALSYEAALRRYQTKLQDIQTVIVYRVYLLDAGMIAGTIESGGFSGLYGWYSRFLPGKRAEDYPRNTYATHTNAWLLLLDPEGELPQDKTYAECLTDWHYLAFGANYIDPTTRELAPSVNAKIKKAVDVYGASTSLLIFRDLPLSFADVLAAEPEVPSSAVVYPLEKPLLSSRALTYGTPLLTLAEEGQCPFLSITCNQNLLFPTEALLEDEPSPVIVPASFETDTLTFSVQYGKAKNVLLCSVTGEKAAEFLSLLGDPAALAEAFSAETENASSSLSVPYYVIDFNTGSGLLLPVSAASGSTVFLGEREDRVTITGRDILLFPESGSLLRAAEGEDARTFSGTVSEAFCDRVRTFLAPYAEWYLDKNAWAALSKKLNERYSALPMEAKTDFTSCLNHMKDVLRLMPTAFFGPDEARALSFWEDLTERIKTDGDAREILVCTVCNAVLNERIIAVCGLHALVETDPALSAFCEENGYTPELTPAPIIRRLAEGYGIS
ncbi:MAG: hypothetical protein IJR89_05280 [Clostridia bacterium]|nr:hypothetical protein [Clostridia bacterium]